MVSNYNILRNPSASNLIEMVLMSIANTSGYYLKEEKGPTLVSNIAKGVITSELERFIKQLKQNLLEKRPCHIGLKKLIAECEGLIEEFLPDQLEDFIREVNSLYQDHFQRKSQIRESARKFFRSLNKKIDDPIPGFNILLFGYSNLVIHALCGFRDCLISQHDHRPDDLPKPDDRHNIYSSEFKKEISKKFRIFICEGQPKTQLNLANGILYHDGFSFANELIKMDFTDLILIPDIIAGNVMEDFQIDFIMMGANGFNEKYFKHSAGHYSILKLMNQLTGEKPPAVILVVTSDKFFTCEDYPDKKIEKASVSNPAVIGGYRL